MAIRTAGLEFQFTPLREGRRDALCCVGGDATISIHAPPRGATRPAADQLTSTISHFNSRPSARGDKAVRGSSNAKSNFNSRPSARGDAIRAILQSQGRTISIHAPPRGATRWLSIAINILIFQFTPLREGRRKARRSAASAYHFNSRPSARGDIIAALLEQARDKISIHAPPRGAT